MKDPAPSDKQVPFSLWYVALLLTLMVGGQVYLSLFSSREIAYSDFKDLVRAGKVTRVAIGDQRITGSADMSGLRASSNAQGLTPTGAGSQKVAPLPAQEFRVTRVPDSTLLADLLAAHVRVTGVAGLNWLGPLLSLAGPALIVFLFWRMTSRSGGRLGGAMDFGKSRAKVYVQKKLETRFADVEGIDEAKAELEEIVDFLKTPDRYRRLGGKIPKGVLIVGAPGTGKTLLAKALAGEAEVPFLSLSGSEFVEMFVGVGAARVRDLFQQGESLAPCIIFIDELDALGKARGVGGISGNDEREQTLNQLLVQLDGFDTRSGVIILAATNRPEILDPALLRPGRFDRQIAIDRPDIVGREKILKVHARKLTLGKDVNLGVIAAKTPGCVGADLANIANEAALRAARHDRAAIVMADFEEAIDRIQTGLEKKGRVMNPKEKERVAHHEAGHALVAESRSNADKVSKVSIIPRGIGALGFTQQLPTEDRYLLTYRELLDRLDVLLGGRVAEELIFGEVSTGAQNDLQRATELARSMVMEYGMSPQLGPATLHGLRETAFLPAPGSSGVREYSEKTAQTIDEEIRRLLEEAEQRVRTTLSKRRRELDSVANALMQRETLGRAELTELLEHKGAPAADAA